MNTPETVHPTEPVGCYGPQASARTTDLVNQRQVWLETDPTQGDVDAYGRTLAYVWVDATTLLQEQLIRGGYGREYTYDTDYVYAGLLRQAQQDARADGAGLWSACTKETR